MSSPGDTLQPVEGEVIPVSRGSYRKFAGISVASVLVGFGLIVLYFTGDRGIASLLVGLFFAVIGLALLPVFVMGMFSNKRLVIGRDRIQVVKGEGNVVGQIPYDNVARVELLKEEQFEAVGIDLQDPNRPDTVWPGGQAGYDFGRKEFGYEISLGHDCELRPPAILEKIAAAMQRSGRAGKA